LRDADGTLLRDIGVSQTPPTLPIDGGREREGVKKLELGLFPKFNANSKTTEIYTPVSTKSIRKIKSPLDNLNLKGGDDK